MIITLKGANFSSCNIGALNLYRVTLSKTSGVSGSLSVTSFEKGQVVSSATVIANLAVVSGYENLTVTITMGGTSVNTWYSNGVVTIPSNTAISGDIKISASATAVSGGEEDEPVTPTMYTFTINPTPTTATVTLTASGYSQSGNSIEVPANTVVTWKVSASGYTEQNGTHTVTKTESKNIALSTVSGGGTSGESIDLNTLSLNHCSSSKIGTGNKENLAYNNETHALTCNNSGWYKCSYFTTPVTEGMEIEFESNASTSITGNFYGIWAEDELVDGIAEVNNSFWPAATFGIYASGGTSSSVTEPLFLWSTTAKKLAIEEYLSSAMNGKTVKYIIKNTGIEAYIDNTKLELPLNTALDSSKTYYFGLRHTCSNKSTQCSKMLYMGPIR